MQLPFIRPLFILLVIMTFSSCKVTELSSKVYHYNHEKFVFPESEFLESKKNIGIAFSGGGNRSASLTTGQLRGLNKLGFLEDVKYISAVSGGSWASIIYTYSPDDLKDEKLLGTYKEHSEIKLEDVVKKPNGELLKSLSLIHI